MHPIQTDAGLKAAIEALEAQRKLEAQQLKAQLLLAYDQIQPINLIKRTFSEVSSSKELKNQMIATTLGMALGYISKSLFVGRSKHPVRTMLGTALMFGVSDLISNNPEAVRALGSSVLRWLKKRKAAQIKPGLNTPPAELHE